MVSLRLSRQVDAPNQSSSANSLFMSLAWHWHTCFAFGCFVALRSLSHSLLLLQPSFGQLLVSFAPLHSLRPSFRYHYTTFVAIRCFISWLPTCQHTKPTHGGKHIPFRKPTLQYSLGFIIASLRPTFISVGFSPPAANNFACLACLPQRRVCHGFCPTTQSLDGNQKHTPNPCILSSCQAPFHGFLATTGAGARSHRRSFLPLVSLMARYAPTPHCGQVCRRALASF